MGELDFSGAEWGGWGGEIPAAATATAPVETAGTSFALDPKSFGLGIDTGGGPGGLALAAEAAGGANAATAPAGGGGFWSRLLSGSKDFLGEAGSVAKAALPIASIGSSVLGAINSRDLMSQVAKQVPITQQAEKQQLSNAQAGAALAPQAAAIAPKIEALAPKFGDLATAAAGEAGKFGDLAGQVRTGVVTPELDYGKKLLGMADAGTLLDADKAKLDEWEQRQIADAEAYLGRSGQGDSSAREEMLGTIRQKRAAAESDILAGYREQALSYLNAGGNAATSGAGALTQQELAALVASGQMTAEQAATLGASVLPLTSAGSILTGSTSAAGGVANTAKSEEQTLEQLIAGLQQQLGLSSGRAA